MADFYDAFDVRPFTLWLHVEVDSQSTELNRSYVTWQLRIRKDGNSTPFNNNSSPFSVTMAGQNWSGSLAAYNFTSMAIGSYAVVATAGRMVYHNADGTMAIGVEAWFNDSGGLLDYAALSGSTTLPTIPRASTPTFSVSSVDAGDPFTIYTNRSSTSFTHTLKYGFGGATGTIATGVTDEYTWTPPLSLLNEIPNLTQNTIGITVETYSGATLIGSKHVSTVMLKAPVEVVPTFTSVSISEATAGVSTIMGTGVYVQGVSKIAATINGAAGVYGSTISAYKIEVGTQVINAASGTTPNPLSGSGTVPLIATVTDSRGRTYSTTTNLTVRAWAPPVVTVAGTQRALSDGTPSEDGTYIRFNLNASVSSLINSTQRNTLTYKLYTKPRGAGSWTLVDTTTPAGLTFSGYEAVAGYPVTDAFDTRIEVIDKFATTAVQSSIAVAAVFMHWDGADGVGVGKYRESGRLDVNGAIYADSQVFRGTGEHIASDGTDLNLNTAGGDVNLGNSSSVHEINGQVVNGYIPYRTATGTVAGANVPAGGNVTAAITFPAGRFTQPPIVVITLTTEARDVVVSATSITTSGFTLNRGAAGTTARSGITCNWVAYQMTSASAAG